MPTPEELARAKIDELLASCGWTVQHRNELNLSAGRGVAVREFPMGAEGFADYLLFVDRKPVGVIEAKAIGTTLLGVAEQSGKYLGGYGQLAQCAGTFAFCLREHGHRNKFPRSGRSSAPVAPRLRVPSPRDSGRMAG